VIIYRSPVEQLSGVYIKYKPGKAQEALKAINASYKLVEPDMTLKYWFQDETFDNVYKTESIASNLVLAFSLVSILIAIIGILGLATFNTLRKNRYFDVRRWKVANQPEYHQGGAFHGMNIDEGNEVSSPEFHQRSVVYTRAVWEHKNYWYPIPQSEIDRNKQLVQNPGY